MSSLPILVTKLTIRLEPGAYLGWEALRHAPSSGADSDNFGGGCSFESGCQDIRRLVPKKRVNKPFENSSCCQGRIVRIF